MRLDGYEVDVPVPGFKPQDVAVTFRDDLISVNAKGERRWCSRSLAGPKLGPAA